MTSQKPFNLLMRLVVNPELVLVPDAYPSVSGDGALLGTILFAALVPCWIWIMKLYLLDEGFPTWSVAKMVCNPNLNQDEMRQCL